MLNDAASTGALRAALLLRDIGPERAVPVMRQLGDTTIRQLLATLPELPAQAASPAPVWIAIWRQRAAQYAAGAVRLLRRWMSAHG
jgi:hypothetical protein